MNDSLVSMILGPAGATAIREFNQGVILDLLRQGGRTTRAELATRSKLTKPTVSAIVDGLVRGGILREVGLDESRTGGGRRGVLLEFNEESAAYLGIHFGASSTVVALADARGGIRRVLSKPSQGESPALRVGSLRAVVSEVLQSAKFAWRRLTAVCAVVPGLVDHESGVCTSAPSLGWMDFALRDALAQELRVPVVVTSAGQASAIAEARLGAARGVRSFVRISVGDEVCSGIVTDGRLFFGHRGFTGEIGHCSVADDGPGCPCGRRGCLSAAVAGVLERGLASEAARIELAEHLGRGISYLVNILNPQMIVLGGPVTAAGDALLRRVRTAVAKHALLPHSAGIVPSTLSEGSEVTGAAILAMEHVLAIWRPLTPVGMLARA